MHDELDEYGINRWVQYKTTSKDAKNQVNWFGRFEDVSRRYESTDVVGWWPSFSAHPVCTCNGAVLK